MKQKLKEKAKNLLSSNSKCKVVISYNPSNSLLAKKLNQTSEDIYDVKGVEKNGILIGNIGHLQLIEWKFIKEIY